MEVGQRGWDESNGNLDRVGKMYCKMLVIRAAA